MEEKIYKVAVVNSRKRFVDWIKNRGGVTVWENNDPLDIGAGEMFTPALTTDGKPYPQPIFSSHKFAETVKNINRFRFIKRLAFIKRIRIAMKPGSNGSTLTDASHRRLIKEIEGLDEVGEDIYWHFEGNNAVIEKAVWK